VLIFLVYHLCVCVCVWNDIYFLLFLNVIFLLYIVNAKSCISMDIYWIIIFVYYLLLYFPFIFFFLITCLKDLQVVSLLISWNIVPYQSCYIYVMYENFSLLHFNKVIIIYRLIATCNSNNSENNWNIPAIFFKKRDLTNKTNNIYYLNFYDRRIHENKKITREKKKWNKAIIQDIALRKLISFSLVSFSL